MAFLLWLRKKTKEIYENINKIILAAFILLMSEFITIITASYTTHHANVREVPDLILGHIPPINLSIVFAIGFLSVFTIFIFFSVFKNPKKSHHYLILIAILATVRAFFITLTHLQNPSTAIPISLEGPFKSLFFENDLFFSGHTAFPFLGFLIFRKESKFLKYFFLASTVVMATTALLMHRHYSIDVFAAFFIAYGVYKFGDWLFKKIRW